MCDFVGKDGLEYLGCSLIARFPPLGRQLTKQVQFARFEGAVLECQSRRQRVQRTGHAPLKVGNRKLSLVTANLTQAPIECGHVPAFVPTLPRQVHAQFPRRLGELDETLCGDLNRSRFVVHVPVDALTPGNFGHPRPLFKLRVAVDHLKAGLAGRIASQRHSFYLLGFFRLHSGHRLLLYATAAEDRRTTIFASRDPRFASRAGHSLSVSRTCGSSFLSASLSPIILLNSPRIFSNTRTVGSSNKWSVR